MEEMEERKMCIDEIMDMLDANNPIEVQEWARMLAKKIKCINVFIQPCHREHNKNVWDNCALILSDRNDDELRPYLCELFRWLQDRNWPRSDIIKRRLNRFEKDELFYYSLNESIKYAKVQKDEMWLENLMDLN